MATSRARRRPGESADPTRGQGLVGIAQRASWWPAFLAGLFVVALAWRALALSRLAAGPLLTELSADSDTYWRWASVLRTGAWLPERPFFLAPLYPYWLALVRSLLGDSIARVLWVQAFLGAGTVVLLADATRRISTPRAGAIVGVALAGYAMSVAFDLQVLGESLLLFLGSLAVWLVLRGGGIRASWIGALIALMGLGRPTLLLLLLPAAAHLLRRGSPRRARTLGALLAAPVVLVALTAFHHWRVERSWTPISYGGGYNFYVGNGPPANGTYVDIAGAFVAPLAPEPDPTGGTAGDGRDYLAAAFGEHLSPTGSSRYWYEAAVEHIRAHPARAARLALRKLGLLFNHRELPQVLDTATYDRAAGPLGWPLDWEFAPLGVFGLLGAVVAWRQGPASRFACGWLIAVVIGCVAFFVVDRYRIHLVPALAPLSGVGLERGLSAWRARTWREAGLVVVIAALAGIFVLAPLVPADPAQKRWSYANTMGDAWLARGQARKALSLYQGALALDRSGVMQGAATAAGRIARARLHENAGIAYSLLKDDREAVAQLAMAVALAPEAAPTRVRLADLLAIDGRFDDARSQYSMAGVPPGAAAGGLVQQAEIRERQGDLDATRRFLVAADGLLPGFEPAIVPLLRLEIMRGALDEASSRLRKAEAEGLDVNLVRAHAAWIRAARGDTAGARRALQSIPGDVRSRDPEVALTLELMERQRGPASRR